MFHEILVRKAVHFFTAVLVFFNMATLTIVRILYIQSYFSMFCSLFFFCAKKPEKHVKKRISKEHRKMMPDAPKMDPRLTPNLFILTENARGETQNLQKWLPKVVFGSIKFWGQILNGKRSEKSGAGVPAMAPAPYPPPPTPPGPHYCFSRTNVTSHAPVPSYRGVGG